MTLHPATGERRQFVPLQPAPGDFGVVHMGGDSGKLIHIAQALNGFLEKDRQLGDDAEGLADYEHAFLYLGGGIIIEAEPGGAEVCKVHYDDILWSTGKIDLTAEQRMYIVKAGFGYAGTPYSAADYFALAAYRLKFGLAVPYLRSYVASSDHMICSQLVDRCYRDAGVHLFNDNRWDGYVTPSDLADLIVKR